MHVIMCILKQASVKQVYPGYKKKITKVNNVTLKPLPLASPKI